MSELPKLTTKQQQFVLHYTINGGNATEAYQKSYNCKDMKYTSITVEASKMLKNPNISLWLEQAKSNVQEVFEEEIKYSAKDCFDELAEVQQRAKKRGGNYQHEIKAIELKGKLGGLFVDRQHITGGGLADVLDQLK